MSERVKELPTPEGDPPKTPQPKPTEEILKPDESGRFKGQHIGIDIDRLEGYIGSLKWKIVPDGHTKRVVDALREIQKGYEVEFHALEDDPKALTWDKEVAYEKSTKAILAICLIDCDYDKAANDIDAGPGALGILANELRTFLVDFGGRAGQKHLQMLSKLATQNILPGSRT